MAKTTKTPAKRANTKQNKNSKQVGIFGKSFDLKSRKVQFFVSIFIIAILGGGYFTFRSFAAENDELLNVAAIDIFDNRYVLKGGNTSASAKMYREYPNEISTSMQPVTEKREKSDKNGLSVVATPWNHGMIWYVSGSTKATNGKAINQTKIKICALASKEGTAGKAKLQLGGYAITGPGGSNAVDMEGGGGIEIKNGITYTEYCAKLPKSQIGAQSYRFWIYNISGANGPMIRVGKISLKDDTPPPPKPAPKPAPAK